MRNLIPLVNSHLSTATEFPLSLVKFVFAEDAVVCCFVGDGLVTLSTWSPKSKWHDSVTWPLDTLAESSEITVCGLHFDSLDHKAIVAFSTGDFVEVCDGQAAIVGSLEMDIDACEFSPTGELCSIVSSCGDVFVLSTDFSMGDVIVGKHQISEDDLKMADKHVNIGWGKRETQFHGRGARASRDALLSSDPTVNLSIDSRTLSPNDNRQVSISWRGDGQFFVINSCFGNQRSLRVFSSDSQLENVSEPVSNLLGFCAYEPRGALIATVRNNLLQFFEKNGLMRYSFAIENGDHVKQLAWSSDSSILSIVYENRIDLWTQKNWHWYRKQSLDHGGYVVWHSELPRTMGVLDLTSRSDISFYTWEFVVTSDQGLVAVIDNNEIKVTPLFRAGVPPPMAYATLQFEEQPLFAAVKTPNEVSLLFKDSVKVLELDLQSPQINVVRTVTVAASRLVYSESSDDNDSSELLIATNTGHLVNTSLEPVIQIPTTISGLKANFYLVGPQLFDFHGHVVANFGEPCVDFVATSTESFGLTRSGKLIHCSKYGSDISVVSHGVTSMLNTSTHLLFTTLTTLNFLHLDNNSKHTEINGEQRREIERGSLLVTIITDQMAVVLQAPRGNLETIYPRMLVLGVVRSCVAKLNYSGAFTACKIHRIDMNLLYDLDPQQFEENVTLVVKQLKNNADIDLFVSSLSDEDVTTTKYIDSTKAPTERKDQKAVEGKTNRVIDIMRPYLSPQCSVTALAMKKPPSLVEALNLAASGPDKQKLIKHLVVLTDSDELYRIALGEYEPKLALAVAQQGQMDPREYLPFLRSLITGSSSHRSKFNIDVYLKRHEKAAEHLIADYKSSMTKNGEYTTRDDEVVEFIIRHQLHDRALELLRGSGLPSELSIMADQAELFLQQSNYVKAGLNFEYLGERDRAVSAYVQGCEWRKALSLAAIGENAQKQSDYKTRITKQLVETCDANKHFGDCAHLCLYYLNQPGQAMHYYCQANQFDDAVLVANSHNLQQDLESLLRECFGNFLELLADCKAQIPSQLKRLRQIRSKRLQDNLGFESMAEQMETLDVADNLSLAGTDATTATGISAYTRYTDKSGAHTVGTNATRRTLKNQRRQERKKARGKKGSVYEEDYLIASTSRLIDRLTSTRPDLSELISALHRCRQDVYARQLLTEFSAVVNLLRDNVEEIYSIDDEALVRYDDSGHEYIAERPKIPDLPPVL